MNVDNERDALVILERVMDVPEESRERYLASNCSGRPDLLRRVRELLINADGPLPRYLVDAPRHSGSPQELSPSIESGQWLGPVCGDVEKLGPYRLLEVLGEGGMGVVYLAEQSKPKRKVALKVLHGRLLSSNGSMRRFERETQLLGRLNHPGIARIYDAGAANVKGRLVPFIAMELVDGEPILSYVAQRCPRLVDKLTLIAKLADAVHGAHKKFVVHLDLKPSNVLVTENGDPKVLDFGIAASTDLASDVTPRSQLGAVVGTLAYMSPEQARGESDAVDVRSDVYSLGLIAFEVLTGKPAFDISESWIDRVVRRVDRGEPQSLEQVVPGLPRDVRAIVSMACQEELSSRYEGTNALAADIRNYLAHRPVAARASSRSYTLQKVVRRNRRAIAGIAALMLSLVGTGISVAGLSRASRSEAEAVSRAEGLEDAKSLQSKVMVSIDYPSMVELILHDVIERAHLALSSGGEIGGVEEQLANFDRLIRLIADIDVDAHARKVLSARVFEVAVRMMEEVPCVRPTDQEDLIVALATMMEDLALSEGSDNALEQVAEPVKGSPSESNTEPTGPYGTAKPRRGRHSVGRTERETPLKRAVKQMQRSVSKNDLISLKDKRVLEDLLLKHGNTPVVVELLEQVLHERLRLLGEDDPATLDSMHALGEVLWELELSDRARDLLRRARMGRLRLFGEEALDSLARLASKATALFRVGNWSQAIRFQRSALEFQIHLMGEDHPASLRSMYTLADMLASIGDGAEARRLYSRAAAIAARM